MNDLNWNVSHYHLIIIFADSFIGVKWDKIKKWFAILRFTEITNYVDGKLSLLLVDYDFLRANFNLNDIPEEEEIVNRIHNVNLNQGLVFGIIEWSENACQRNDQPDCVKLSVTIRVIIFLIENRCHDDVALKRELISFETPWVVKIKP